MYSSRRTNNGRTPLCYKRGIDQWTWTDDVDSTDPSINNSIKTYYPTPERA